MRALLIHAKKFWFKARSRAIKEAEEVEKEAPAEAEASNALVAFITVEDKDKDALNEIVEKAVEDIASVAEKVGAERIVVYPYSHLSKLLAPPRIAIEALRELASRLAARTGKEVILAPFGWYK
jgi:threonyl-tRNA synthetase